MAAGMGKDNRAWHRATQRSPQELAEALAALAADVGEPTPRQRPRRTAAPPVREPWASPAPQWPEPELEAESVPEAQDLGQPFPLPEPESEPVPEEPEPVRQEPEALPPAPEALHPAPEAFQPEPDPEPPAGGLIVGRSLTGGQRPPAPSVQPTSREQWDDAPLPDPRTPHTARAAWTAQGVRSRAAGGRMRPPSGPGLRSGRGARRPGPSSRRGLILLIAGVLVVVLVVIIALSGGGSSKPSSTGSVTQSASSTPTTVVIPPPATSATTPKHAAPTSHTAARLRARCKVAKFRKHHPHKCHVS